MPIVVTGQHVGSLEKNIAVFTHVFSLYLNFNSEPVESSSYGVMKSDHLPVFLSALHEIQAFVKLCLHLVDVGYGVD